MTLSISLPEDAEAGLKCRATVAGTDVNTYLEQLIARELAAPLSLIEAAEPIAQAVDASNVTDDEFTAILVQSRDASASTVITGDNGTNANSCGIRLRCLPPRGRTSPHPISTMPRTR